jgi:pimeloyl-ACP methyl ester carboxylesterase
MVRLAYEVRGSGAPLLLVHGLGYARWGWEPVLDPFAERFRVVAFDNRGVGESDAPPGPYTARVLAEDAVAVLDAAGIDRAHVVATSLGGMAAQELAVGWPGRVERLVLACTTPGGAQAYPMPDQTVRLLAEVPFLQQEIALRRLVENALSPGAPEALVERILAYRLASPPDPAGWQAQAAAGMSFDGADSLGEIRAPTLVLHGTEDAVVDQRNAELLAAGIPNAQLVFFRGTGHLFFWEQPERFTQVVAEFLTNETR